MKNTKWIKLEDLKLVLETSKKLDIPKLEPITTKIRQLNPEIWRETVNDD